MSEWEYGDNDMLTPGEVAEQFRVDPKTVSRWARKGRIPDLDGRKSVIMTPGRHTRIRAKAIRVLLTGQDPDATEEQNAEGQVTPA